MKNSKSKARENLLDRDRQRRWGKIVQAAMDDEDQRFSRLLSEIEGESRQKDIRSDFSISYSALSDLQSILESGNGEISNFWSVLASRNLSLSSLVKWIAAAMECNDPRSSLLASRVYLSILLSDSAPVHSLFNPLAFLSLLRSLRRAVKIQNAESESSPDETRKRKSRRREKVESAEESLLHVFKLLEMVLDKVQLDTVPDGAKSLIDTVAGILGNQSLKFHLLLDSCFRILISLVSNPQHGNQSKSAVESMRALSPIVYLPVKTATRAATLRFFTNHLAKLGRESEAIGEPLSYWPRYLSVIAPDKSEPRASAVDAIVEVLKVMELTDQVSFVEFVTKMAQGKTHLRFLAVELNLSLLSALPNPMNTDEGNEHADGLCMSWGVTCLQTLLDRCSDVSTSIRARALTNLAHAIEFLSKNRENYSSLQSFITSRYDKLTSLLVKRCSDEKAAVRKASLLLITKYTLLTGRPMDEIVLKTIGRACSDPLISIRKAAVSALSEVSWLNSSLIEFPPALPLNSNNYPM